MKSRKKLLLLVGTTLSMVIGCAASPNTDREFGNSVRQMVRSQQVYAPADEGPVEGGDGQRLETVLDVYRQPAPATDGPPSSSILINTER